MLKGIAIMLLFLLANTPNAHASRHSAATVKATHEVSTARSTLKVARDHLHAAKAAERIERREKAKARAMARAKARAEKEAQRSQVETDPADY